LKLFRWWLPKLVLKLKEWTWVLVTRQSMGFHIIFFNVRSYISNFSISTIHTLVSTGGCCKLLLQQLSVWLIGGRLNLARGYTLWTKYLRKLKHS
jgi:hypothetical protein